MRQLRRAITSFAETSRLLRLIRTYLEGGERYSASARATPLDKSQMSAVTAGEESMHERSLQTGLYTTRRGEVRTPVLARQAERKKNAHIITR